MIRKPLGGFPLLLLASLLSTQAMARRTVVDFDPIKQQVLFKTLSGYCDLDGQDCSPTTLPFSVDFGSGALGSIIVYGNGLVSFGTNPVDLTNIDQYNGSLSFFGGTVLSPILDNSTLEDYAAGGSGLQVFAQNARVIGVDDGVRIDWLYTNSTTSSFLLYSALLNPENDGLHVAFSYNHLLSDYLNSSPPIANSGYSIEGGMTVELPTRTGRSFVIPASFGTVGAVPEPTTWLMMLAGLGLIGSAARHRRARAAVACC